LDSRPADYKSAAL